MADGGSAPPEGLSIVPSVYVDTSIPSYLTAKRSRVMPMARHQLVTCLWWNGHRSRFRLYVSNSVLLEARRGDPEAAQRRIQVIATLPTCPLSDAVERLTSLILHETDLPIRAEADAEHIAIAAINGMDFLVTWNCKHLANPVITPKVIRACQSAGFRCPQIRTPEAIIRQVVYRKPVADS